MKLENKVLACVDQSHFANTVADYAAWAARRLGASLEFLHVIDRHPAIGPNQDHSGAIGLNAQENLLNQLSSQDEARSRTLRDTGRLFLNYLRERALGTGVASVDVRQRHGDIEATLSEQQAGVHLYVLGRRGVSAETGQRELGRNVEWVVRAVACPILVVSERYTEPRRVLLAFEGSSVTRRGVEMIAASPLLKGLPIHVLMSGKAPAQGPKQVAWARQTLQDAGFTVTTEVTPGDPETVIAQAVKEQQADLLVMGAHSHSPLRTWLFGSKTTDLLRSAAVATLLLR